MGKLFYKSKGKITDKGVNDYEGEPNTNMDIYRKRDGRFHRRRKFGKDGYATKDLDSAEGEPNQGDHVHDINKGKRSTKHREPTKKEQREINKAKRKRRGWNGDRFQKIYK